MLFQTRSPLELTNVWEITPPMQKSELSPMGRFHE